MDVFWLGNFVVVSLQSPVDSHILLLHLSMLAGFGLSKHIHCPSHLYRFVVGLLGWVVAVSLGRFVVVIFGFFVVVFWMQSSSSLFKQSVSFPEPSKSGSPIKILLIKNLVSNLYSLYIQCGPSITS